jgi:hypothetical protein
LQQVSQRTLTASITYAIVNTSTNAKLQTISDCL